MKHKATKEKIIDTIVQALHWQVTLYNMTCEEGDEMTLKEAIEYLIGRVKEENKLEDKEKISYAHFKNMALLVDFCNTHKLLRPENIVSIVQDKDSYQGYFLLYKHKSI